MQITHEEARMLIQRHADGALDMHKKIILSAHLEDCGECRNYAEEIKEMERILVPMMSRLWALQPVPLSVRAIQRKRIFKVPVGIGAILATRKTAIGVVLLALLFSAWQFAWSGGQASSKLPVSSLPVPTPSVYTTSTKVTPSNCAEILYIVQENDTLEGIARQYSISQEEIMLMNNLQTQTISVDMKLMIPICDFTPTGTVNPTLFSTTYTPSISPVASTPTGG